MEKGTLIVAQGKRDKKNFRLLKDRDKTVTVQAGDFDKRKILDDLELGEVEVQFELEKGQVSKLVVNCETLEKIEPKVVVHDSKSLGGGQRRGGYRDNRGERQRGEYRGRGDEPQQDITIDGAFAPYNFVPLNQKVIRYNHEACFNVFKGLSGYIELDICSKSPLFIRGTLTQEEVNNNEEAKDKEDHYKPAGQVRLPGSSIRGMVRSLYEIVSCSKMGFIDDRKLYFRSFADTSLDFRNLYNRYMFGTDMPGWRATPNIKPGYLKKERGSYFIYEADGYYRVNEDLAIKKGMVTNRLRTREYVNEIKEKPYVRAFFKVGKDAEGKEIVTEIDKYSKQMQAQEGYLDGYLILSGYMNKKRKHWVIGPITGKRYDVPEDVIRDYDDDASRDAINLINPATKKKDKDKDASRSENKAPKQPSLKERTDKLLLTDGVPCFFIADGKNNEVITFGHTAMFRIAYRKSIGDLLPPEHRNPNISDMAEALFGKVNEGSAKPGRVYFEDAIATKAEELQAAYPKILSGPKPNSFQLYLKQDKGKIQPRGSRRVGVSNYDSKDAQLVGRKLYWHRDHNGWIADQKDVEDHPTQYTKIKPLKEGAEFKGRIRFDNLSDIELGALLFVLDLPAGCCHKIGMGKPLGFGSIEIRPTLTLIDRKERYSSFKKSGEIEETDLDQYKKAFEKHLGTTGSAWESRELKELLTMLNYEKRPSHQKTKYMEIEGDGREEYRQRQILKKPSEYPKQ